MQRDDYRRKCQQLMAMSAKRVLLLCTASAVPEKNHDIMRAKLKTKFAVLTGRVEETGGWRGAAACLWELTYGVL
jgi:hypothetical protein